ncbi:MAG: serine/threonine-protein kinase [Kofleriaceae bacterium]
MEDRTTFDSLIANIARVSGGDERIAQALIGQTFGNYRVVAKLGAGGMGWVFLAEHTVLGSRAALKVLKPTHSQQQHVVQRFFDEARAATRIADPGIVTVLDFGWNPSGAAYLVMEYLTGETLAQRIHGGGPLPPAQALAMVRQCAIAMSSAHARGIVHRDLKPDNIFIVPDPAVASERIKILDFGIAKLLGDGDASHAGTSTGMILGTPGYMSPEQGRGAGDVDHRTDIYALGCVLFFMLCGRPPFLAKTPADLIADHLTVLPPEPSSFVRTIPPAVDALVAGCLAKAAGDRPQTMQDVVAAIDRITAPRRSRAWLAIAGGLALAAITAVGVGSSC